MNFLKKIIKIKNLIFILVITVLITIIFESYQYFLEIKNVEWKKVNMLKEISKINNQTNSKIKQNNVNNKNKEKKINKTKTIINTWINNSKINLNKELNNNIILVNDKKNIENSNIKKNNNKNININNSNDILLSWNFCFYWYKNYNFILFISSFDYKNLWLLNYLKYRKFANDYKKYSKKIYLWYYCIKNLKITEYNLNLVYKMLLIYKKYLKNNKKSKNEIEQSKEKKIFDYYLNQIFKLNSNVIFKWEIIKDAGLWKLEKISWCKFSNFNKFLRLNWIIFDEKNEENTNCFIKWNFNFINLEKNTNIKYYYDFLFKNLKQYNKNNKYFPYFKWYYYSNAIQKFAKFLIYKSISHINNNSKIFNNLEKLKKNWKLTEKEYYEIKNKLKQILEIYLNENLFNIEYNILNN